MGLNVDALNLKLEKARACISDLEAKNEFFYQESIHLKKRLDVYYSLHEGKNDVFDTVTGIVDELEKAFRVTFEFTEPSLKGMAELFRKEKAKMEYQYANIEYVDKMFDKIMKAEKSLKEKEEKEHIYTIGGLELNEDRKAVSVDGEDVKVTPTEYKILLLLMKHPGRVFSADEIYEWVWEEEAVNTDTIMVHVRNIREKIEINPKEPKYLKVVCGVGYKIEKQA